MPLTEIELSQYGGHSYLTGIGPCDHGCGCIQDGLNSYASPGLSFLGLCPNNPKSGTRLPGREDWDRVITLNMRMAERTFSLLDGRVKALEEAGAHEKQKLLERISELETLLEERENWIDTMVEEAKSAPKRVSS